jgi:hypothetical protein
MTSVARELYRRISRDFRPQQAKEFYRDASGKHLIAAIEVAFPQWQESRG